MPLKEPVERSESDPFCLREHSPNTSPQVTTLRIHLQPPPGRAPCGLSQIERLHLDIALPS